MRTHVWYMRFVVATGLALALCVGCGSATGAGDPDAGAALDGATIETSPREAQSISAAAGRVTRDQLVFDVEVGYSASRAPADGVSHDWHSGSPVIP